MSLASVRENKIQPFMHHSYFLNLKDKDSDKNDQFNEASDSDDSQLVEKKLKVLLVEDDKVLQHCHMLFLNSCNYAVELATTGAEAIEMFQKTTFDIVVLDIGLPDENIDGYDVCKAMKQLSKQVPIMFLSTNDKEINKFEQSNGDYYMSKPPCFTSMQEKIIELVKLSKGNKIN